MRISQEPADAAVGEPLEPEQIVRLAVAAAVQAPSVHNTQPWWFSEEEHEIFVCMPMSAGSCTSPIPAVARC